MDQMIPNNRIVDILKWMYFSDVFLIFEESERLKPKFQKYASAIKLHEELDGVKREIPVFCGMMNKKYALPGLEVADYIIHSVGSACRDRNVSKIHSYFDREDIRAIFQGGDEKNQFIYRSG